jgi:CO/xanthine dehydrogenase FAD-binding subunit
VKPVPFAYQAPPALDEALSLLGQGACPLAGGQSLIARLNFRLARPSLVVDLNRLSELEYLRVQGGTLRIGALTRQVTLARSEVVARGWPLLGQAARLVGHEAIRTRGTIGGSAAEADPTAELPAALIALDARLHVRSVRGERTVRADEFFLAAQTTALEPDELLTEIEVPALPASARSAFVEHAATCGGVAIAGAAVLMASDEHVAVVLLGTAGTPKRVPEAERALLAGAGPFEAARIAAGGIEPAYWRALVAELARRAILAASG